MGDTCREDSSPACDPRESVSSNGGISFFTPDRVFVRLELNLFLKSDRYDAIHLSGMGDSVIGE